MHGTRLTPLKSLFRKSSMRGLPIVGFFLLFAQFMSASSTAVVTGSYTLLRHVIRGSQAQIQMRIHLVNHGASDLSIRRITLWDFSHPANGGSKVCALTLRANASTDTTKEFTIDRAEYQQWQRGTKPRFVLQIGPPGTAEHRIAKQSTTVVRLDPITAKEAK